MMHCSALVQERFRNVSSRAQFDTMDAGRYHKGHFPIFFSCWLVSWFVKVSWIHKIAIFLLTLASVADFERIFTFYSILFSYYIDAFSLADYNTGCLVCLTSLAMADPVCLGLPNWPENIGVPQQSMTPKRKTTLRYFTFRYQRERAYIESRKLFSNICLDFVEFRFSKKSLIFVDKKINFIYPKYINEYWISSRALIWKNVIPVWLIALSFTLVEERFYYPPLIEPRQLDHTCLSLPNQPEDNPRTVTKALLLFMKSKRSSPFHLRHYDQTYYESSD